MAELVVNIIKAGSKLITVLRQVRLNKKDADKIQKLIDHVNRVCADVEPMKKSVLMEGDTKLAFAAASLKDALVEAEAEVAEFFRTNVVLQAVKVNEMTEKFASLRRDIRDLMATSTYAICNDTNMTTREMNATVQQILREMRDQHMPRRSSSEVEMSKPRIWTRAELHAQQMEDIGKVSNALKVPLGAATVLLRRCNWMPELVEKKWRQRKEQLCKEVGLRMSSVVYGCKVKSRKEQCDICFDDGGSATAPWKMVSAGCSHYYCEECWRQYIHVAVGTGSQQCLSLRCPDPSCTVAVLPELVIEVGANAADTDRYTHFLKSSYVDDSDGRMKWCPGPGCSRAVEFLDKGKGNDMDMVVAACDCNHNFCWSCGEEPHWPVPCVTARLWLDTISDRSDWVLMFTKRCPRCRRTMENDLKTNIVTCGAPCCRQFCWICLHHVGVGGSKHTACCAFYRDSTETDLQQLLLLQPLPSSSSPPPLPQHPHDAGDGAVVVEFTPEMQEKRQALVNPKKDASLVAMGSNAYERWAANQASLQESLTEMDCLGLSELAKELGLEEEELDFVVQAYKMITRYRRRMGWMYAYQYYYLDPRRNRRKWDQFQRRQKAANDTLRRLQDIATRERLNLYGVDVEFILEKYTAFKTSVILLMKEAQRIVHKLMTVVETD